MTLQNDVLNPGPLLNQHPRKACKSMRARVGRPCCGGYPCQPPKMHQISKEVVRDWSLWGSWCFSIFLMISRNLLRQEDARRQKLLLHVLMWMMLMNAYDLCNAFLSRIHLVFLHNDSSCILLYLFCLNFIPWTPTQKKKMNSHHDPEGRSKTRGLLQIEAQSEHLQAPQKRAAKSSWTSKNLGEHVNSIQFRGYVEICWDVFRCLQFNRFKPYHCVVLCCIICISLRTPQIFGALERFQKQNLENANHSKVPELAPLQIPLNS